MPSTDDTPQDLVGCLHQNANNLADKFCLHVLGDDGGTVNSITYSELWLKACGFAVAFETAGVEPGDVVLSLDGEPVSGPRSLQGIVERLAVDKPYKIEILRDGKRVSVPIVLKQMPDEYTMANVGRQEREEPEEDVEEDVVEVGDYGFKVRELNQADRLGLGSDEGVVVSSVDSNGAAARILSVGDVILKVSNRNVESVADFNKGLADVNPEKGLFLFVRSGNGTRFTVIRQRD